MRELVQPILSDKTEPGHRPENALPLSEFVKLLREEEDYWEGDQHNTKLIITRLRKIFYDQWGWNSELIRGAAKVETRYQVTIAEDSSEHSKEVRRYKNREYQPKHRVITYTDHDRVYGASRVGEVPFIYKNDHQEVLLPVGYYCDIAHILAGLDAYNHPQVVSPLPPFLSFLNFLAPHVDKSEDIVTWLGDIASSSGDFLFTFFKNGHKPLDHQQSQYLINKDAPGSDMLGNIDAFLISRNYDVGVSKGMRFTDILTDYYTGEGNKFRERRCSLYCQYVGLKNWDGQNFSNEKQWLRHYRKQLRDNVCFQVFSLTDEKLDSVWLPLAIWTGMYKPTLKMELMLQLFLKALKSQIIKEPNT